MPRSRLLSQCRPFVNFGADDVLLITGGDWKLTPAYHARQCLHGRKGQKIVQLDHYGSDRCEPGEVPSGFSEPVLRLCVSFCLNARLPADIKIITQFFSTLVESLSIPLSNPRPARQPSTVNRQSGSRTLSHKISPSCPFSSSGDVCFDAPNPENRCNAKRTSLPSSVQPYDMLVSTIGPKWTRLNRAQLSSLKSPRISYLFELFPPTIHSFIVLQGQRGIYPTPSVDPPRTRSPHVRLASGFESVGLYHWLANFVSAKSTRSRACSKHQPPARLQHARHELCRKSACGRSHLGQVRQSKVTS